MTTQEAPMTRVTAPRTVPVSRLRHSRELGALRSGVWQRPVGRARSGHSGRPPALAARTPAPLSEEVLLGIGEAQGHRAHTTG